MTMRDIKLILIAGPSGSGKSTFAQGLSHFLTEKGKTNAVISLDNYYRDLSHLSETERASSNFDQPNAWELERIIQDAQAIKTGQAVDIPHYDFATHSRTSETTRIKPKDFVLFEGLFALCVPELNEIADIRIFVELDDDIALKRRIKRDTQERGRSRESVITQYQSTVLPANQTYIRPSAANAHIKIAGIDPLELQLSRIKHLLEKG